MRKTINEKSEPVFAPKGGKPGYIINGKWYPVDKADLNTPQLKREMERYAQLRGVEQLKKDEASLKSKPQPAKPAPQPAKPEPAKPLTPNQEYQKLREKDPEAAKKLGMEIWAKKYAKTLAPEVVRRQERATMLGRGNTQSGYPVIKKYVQPSVEKAKVGEAYDVVLDYLLSEGHAETVEEAHYVMMQLDSEFIQNIIEN